ncbi:uncharacterized protein N7473_010794 [Penicillium subrubescens]|uniref:uncharacterized protein n=1 Tax=Penicillium subrubescens TaxID=1316194 RepID=UPI002544FD9A|nr:uncharacterized protein N7473_010794 [Penicillium subrubescens]KAJ5883908.1 hypothetical protein N7473_010794 [Penicillium subrubescens]
MLIGHALSRGNAESGRMGIVGHAAAVVSVGYRGLEMGKSPRWQGWAMPWPLGKMVSRRKSAARNNLIEEKPSRSDEQAGWDRPALTGSRDDLRGVAREVPHRGG